jgi:hypothetical protein
VAQRHVVGGEKLGLLREEVKNLADQFVNDWLAAHQG